MAGGAGISRREMAIGRGRMGGVIKMASSARDEEKVSADAARPCGNKDEEEEPAHAKELDAEGPRRDAAEEDEVDEEAAGATIPRGL